MEKKNYFYDLHCHTEKSDCSPADIKSIVRMAKERGLDGVAITDHNVTYKGPLSINGIDIIPGNEITVTEENHLLAFFVTEDIEERKGFEKTISEIRRQGGYAVWAHPLRRGNAFPKKGEEFYSLFDGLESGNAMNEKKEKDLISKKAQQFSLLQTAGSDAHTGGQVGMSVLKVPRKITKENFRDVLREGEIVRRNEISGFRKSHKKWEKFLILRLKTILMADNYAIPKKIFFYLFFRNYLRLRNRRLEKMKFNHKKDEK